MHLDGLDLNLLVALDALLTEKNVTLAAEKLCVSQPAMSASLSKLRYRLSDPLFERVGRDFIPTPFALEMVQPVQDLLLKIKSTLNRTNKFDPNVDVRSLRLQMSSYCAKVFGIPALREMNRHAPNVRCFIEEVEAEVFLKIQSSELDYGITLAQMDFHKPVSEPENLDRSLLFVDNFVLVYDLGNRSIGPELEMASFCRMQFVGTRQNRNLISFVERILQTQFERPQICITVSSADMALDAVLGSNLVTIVPSMALNQSAHRKQLGAIKPPLEIPPLHQTLTWHSRTSSDPFHIWFRAFMREFSQDWANSRHGTEQRTDHPASDAISAKDRLVVTG